MLEAEKKRLMKEDALNEIDKSKRMKQIRDQNEKMLSLEKGHQKEFGVDIEAIREKQRMAQEQQKRNIDNYNQMVASP
eukprot:CAMPEP_0202963934 /NCGR_PEP_ID=MMETSP1396-20130829/7997_1 /ASSEMBLY_ACC=CAM_ASM_000872 /TAXON_ID= /ORGANISM="Pseudokeronopsis sp., Strain Brazil" /LENGTH=77 /DNA_ID=CAMNT_0049685617 /DNA_START=515 /DNA_END=748 /DNA_ORIENTATION=-